MKKAFVLLLVALAPGTGLAVPSPVEDPPPAPPTEGVPPPMPSPPGNPPPISPPPGNKKPAPNLGQIICIVTKLFGINLEFCEMIHESRRYYENYFFTFDPSAAYALKALDSTGERGIWLTKSINEILTNLGYKPIPELGKHNAGTVLAEAVKDPGNPGNAIESAIDRINRHYEAYVQRVENEVLKPYEERVNKFYNSMREKEQRISELRKKLRQVPPGSAESQDIVNQIKQLEEEWNATYREALSYVRKEYPRVKGALDTLYRVSQLAEEERGQARRSIGVLGGTKAVKHIVDEQQQEIESMIKKAEGVVEDLVKTAKGANSTRATMVVAVEALGALITGQTYMTSVLHQALMELAQQNVYTNEAILALGNEIAAQQSRELAQMASETAHIMGINLGKLENLEGNVNIIQKASERLAKNPCRRDWFWRSECSGGVDNGFGREVPEWQWVR